MVKDPRKLSDDSDHEDFIDTSPDWKRQPLDAPKRAYLDTLVEETSNYDTIVTVTIDNGQIIPKTEASGSSKTTLFL